MRIITINERASLKNNHLCSFCGDEKQKVVGCAYFKSKRNYPKKEYMFFYCSECAFHQAFLLARVADPDARVIK